MSGELDGKVAIVTGAARGIGRAIASSLAQHGASVLVADVDESGAEECAETLRSAGGKAGHLRVDVSSAADTAAMARKAVELFGRIDVLCPNAAIFDGAPIETMPEELWDRLLGVNLKGVFLCVQACVPQMKSQRFGRIAVTSSITGPRTAIPGMAHYAASKGGINGFIRAAALELAVHNITVNGIEPGHVMTPGAAPMYDEEFVRAVEAFVPVGRFAAPEDIARAALYLASDESGYMTGQTIVIDGGVTLPEYPPGYPKRP